MSTAKKEGPSPIVKLAGVGIVLIGLYYGYQMLGQAQQWIERLPVEGLRAEETAEETASPRRGGINRDELHPLLVASNSKLSAYRERESQGELTALDGAFGRDRAQAEREARLAAEQAAREAAAKEREALEKAQKAGIPPGLGIPLPPVTLGDTFSALERTARVQALMTDGAIINGDYVEVGQPISSLRYPSSDAQRWLTPTLARVSAEAAYVQEANAKRVLRLKLD